MNLRLLLSKHTLLILGIGLTLWAYGTLTDILFVYYQQVFFGDGGGRVVYVDMDIRWLQHLMLLPPLLLGYGAAVWLQHRCRPAWLMWTLQAGLGLLYALICRPMFFASIALVHGRVDFYMDQPTPLKQLLFGSLFMWISNATSNFVLYMMGVFLLMMMLSRLDLAEERLRLERLSSEWLAIKLRTLQWQINPHFLFNSLNTVSSLLRSSPGRADQVLSKFGELLRMTLKEQENLYTTVSDELEYVHRYLEMEKIRFEDRLKLSIEADEASLEGWVPSLLLQPIIENAIKHGVARVPGAASIEVNVARRDGNLVMRVKNSSPGAAAPPDDSGTGFGMRHLKERLDTIYRDTFSFSYGPDGAGAWVASIELPFTTRAPG
ncbi:MAG TPA: histidine kinase [Gammaproteobacteria bacterium]|jgi:sensor histidine kinase YesM|nr:histidine kinase [Gammaproteobacteria bacterium]